MGVGGCRHGNSAAQHPTSRDAGQTCIAMVTMQVMLGLVSPL